MTVKHVNPRSPERTAVAPYNFVPLPERVVAVVSKKELDACKTDEERQRLLDERLPDHDSYAPPQQRHTGHLVVSLTTCAPLYTRRMLTFEEFQRQAEGKYADGEKMPDDPHRRDFRRLAKNVPEFFYVDDRGRPVISGSSLRGMLRNLVEIVSYGKMQWVTDKRLFFRTVDNSAVGKHYRDRMVGNIGKKVETGFLREKNGQTVIKVCPMARVPRDLLGDESGNNLYEGRSPNQKPRWDGSPHQHEKCWVETNAGGWLVTDIQWTRTQGHLREGRLVITGNMNNKKKEFVFLLPDAGAEEVAVPEERLKRFHDDDQITQWQENAFPRNQPAADSRERDGLLPKNLQGEGEPVFFLREPDENGQPQLTFFGRAQMFRLPYRNRPVDLVPQELHLAEDIDLAEALFGYVKPKKTGPDDLNGVEAEQGSKARAYAGRVVVTDATLDKEQDDVLYPDPIVPRLLATPKPTAFQHYLAQPSQETDPERHKKSLSHYDSPTEVPPIRREPAIYSEETIIRGHKLYWHQADPELAALKESDPYWLENGQVKSSSTQHTQMRPVKSHKTFTFHIYFENLSEEELGALCWAVCPAGDAEKYRHSLGMGKPLGLGAVKLDATLFLTDRTTRYGSLFDGHQWQSGTPSAGERLSDPAVWHKRTLAFEQYVLKILSPLDKPCSRMAELERIGMLLKLLEWPGPKRDSTRYMLIKGRNGNEYKGRPVLPDPSAFGALTGSAAPLVKPKPTAPVRAAADLPRPKPAGPVRVADEPPQPASQPRRPQRQPVEALPEVREQVSDEAKSVADLLAKRAAEREAEEEKRKQARAAKKKRR